MVANVGRYLFYCGQKTRGEYDLAKTQLEKKCITTKACCKQQPKIKTTSTKANATKNETK